AATHQGAGEQQVREVGARDEQDTDRRATEPEQEQARLFGQLVAQTEDGGANLLVLLRVLALQQRRDDAHVRLRLLHRDAALQFRENLELVVVPFRIELLRHRDRRPQLDLPVWKVE